MQRWLIEHKTSIIRFWYGALIAWFLFFLLSTQLSSVQFWVWIGKKVGTVALITFWIVLIPGMMKRFQITGWLLPVRTVLMLYRRQIGVTVYVLATTHYWWSRMLPLLSVGADIFTFRTFEIMGVTAITLLTPLFLTSNDWSLKHLGKWWNRIHSLVYIVIWILFLHVALQDLSWKAFVTLIVAAFELFSLIWAKAQQPPPKPAA